MKLHVNGQVREFEAEEDTPLLWVIREQLGLTGTKYGCGVAQCGACTVHIDGEPTRSCVRPVSTVTACSSTAPACSVKSAISVAPIWTITGRVCGPNPMCRTESW